MNVPRSILPPSPPLLTKIVRVRLCDKPAGYDKVANCLARTAVTRDKCQHKKYIYQFYDVFAKVSAFKPSSRRGYSTNQLLGIYLLKQIPIWCSTTWILQADKFLCYHIILMYLWRLPRKKMRCTVTTREFEMKDKLVQLVISLLEQICSSRFHLSSLGVMNTVVDAL